MPPYYFLLSYFTLLFTIDQDVFYSNSISHTLRQILYRVLYILHPLARQFHPGLALFLHAASVFIACLFICKTQSMSANRIKMHFYRNFKFAPLPLTLSTAEHKALYGGAMWGAIRALPVADTAR